MTNPRIRPTTLALALGIAAIVVGALRSGLGQFPQSGVLYDVAVHWQDPRAGDVVQPHNDYLLANGASAATAGILGLAATPLVYLGWQLLLAMLAVLVPFLMPAVRTVPDRARALFVVLVGGPVAALLFVWVGGYDPLTVIGAALVGLSRRRWVLLAGWFVIGLNHTVLGVVGLALWLPMYLLVHRDRPRREVVVTVLASAGAAAAGALAWMAVVASWGGASSRLDWFLAGDYATFIRPYLGGIAVTIVSVLGIGWVLFGERAVQRSKPARVVLAVALLAALLLPLVAMDQTRIAALAVLPAVYLGVIGAFPAEGGAVSSRAWWAYGIGAVALPTVLVFGWQASVLWWT